MRFGQISILAPAALAAITIGITTSQAAETVLGSGDAQACYQAADSGQDFVSSIQYCNRALNGVLSQNDRAATLINRGILYMSSAQYNAALTDFDAGLALNPQMGEGHVDRGATLIAQKRFAEGIKEIDAGISLGSKRQELAFYDRAMADEALGNIQKAYEDYKQASTIAPDFTLANTQLTRFKVVVKSSGT